MRHTEDLEKGRRAAMEKLVRRIVQEEIAKAFGALGREAASLDMPYETAELDSRALENIKQAAEGTVQRLTCPHEKYSSWGGLRVQSRSRCDRCGEPEPEPEDPFKDPACNHAYALEDSPSCLLCGSPHPRKEKTDGTS